MEDKKYEYYRMDDCAKVKEYYREIYDFYDENTFGGEAIFSINTIQLELCKLLNSNKIYDAIFNIDREENNLEQTYVISDSTLEACNIKDLDAIDINKYNKIFCNLESERECRFITLMSTKQMPNELKAMLIHYSFTIRKLGNYMPLLKLRMNGNYTGNCNTINQRKGNYKSYKDDPIKFYPALGKFLIKEKNSKFKQQFNLIYGENDENLDNFLKKNYLCHLKDYMYDEEYYLASRLGNSKNKKSNQEKLDGLYRYMYYACKIIDERHQLIFEEYKKK